MPPVRCRQFRAHPWTSGRLGDLPHPDQTGENLPGILGKLSTTALPAPSKASGKNNFPFSGEIFVQVRVSEIRFESEIPVVFRNADLCKKIPGNAVVILARTLRVRAGKITPIGQDPERAGHGNALEWNFPTMNCSSCTGAGIAAHSISSSDAGTGGWWIWRSG